MKSGDFVPFPKIGRLTRECIITEKIDGTNAQVLITEVTEDMSDAFRLSALAQKNNLVMFAGSRTRYITPDDDNFGFAAWVKANAEQLFELGPGRHFGEWWGQKIQRGYGLTEKRFSLFNTTRWKGRHTESGVVGDDWPAVTLVDGQQQWAPACCHVVPELYRGLFSDRAVDNMLLKLKHEGSQAAPFLDPEGVVVFHTASGVAFKKLLTNDSQPKGQVAA